MFQRHAFLFSFWLALLGTHVSGCVNSVVKSECETTEDCTTGQCVLGKCEVGTQVNLSCVSNADCDEAGGEQCIATQCQRPGDGQVICNNTFDCPIESYCNTNVGLCQLLAEGGCREDTQCSGAAPFCSSSSPAVPGHCVPCRVNEHCNDNFVCVGAGVCEPAPTTGGRPGDGSGNPGGGNNPGGGMDTGGGGSDTGGTGGGNPGGGGDSGGGGNPGGGGSDDVCELNGVYGDGTCDVGCPRPDPDCESDPGSGGGGGAGGFCSETADCWSAGFSINYTCAVGECVCNTQYLQQIVCETGQTVDVTTCTCVNPGGGGNGDGNTGGGGGGGSNDLCEVFNYYNDGLCDDFCSQPDPDCSAAGGGGGEGGLLENQACVDGGGVVRQCAAGLECVWVGDANNTPLYGSCKQYCSTDAECGGGRSCAVGFLANGLGICGTPLVSGQTGCNFWEQGDSFCFDPNTPSGNGWALLECLSGTCGYICDYQGNALGQFLCPIGSCSESIYAYDGYNVALGVCEF